MTCTQSGCLNSEFAEREEAAYPAFGSGNESAMEWGYRSCDRCIHFAASLGLKDKKWMIFTGCAALADKGECANSGCFPSRRIANLSRLGRERSAYPEVGSTSSSVHSLPSFLPHQYFWSPLRNAFQLCCICRAHCDMEFRGPFSC